MKSNYCKRFGNTVSLKFRDFNMETTNDKGTYNHIHSDFEKAYISLRKSEGRLFADYEVLQLPDVSEGHPYYKEWHIRKRSSKRLFRHLQSLNKPLSILEVGCGNGWLSALLSQLAGSTITGIDINLFELDQAKKLFAALNNVQFIE